MCYDMMYRHTLCDEGSLRNEGLIAPSSPREPSTVAGEDGLLARREGYIRRALDVIVPRPAQNIYRWRLSSDLSFRALDAVTCRCGHVEVFRYMKRSRFGIDNAVNARLDGDVARPFPFEQRRHSRGPRSLTFACYCAPTTNGLVQ